MTGAAASTDAAAGNAVADGADAVRAGIDGTGLADCEDVSEITARQQGPLRTTQNYPSGFAAAVVDYGVQFGTYGGYWLDRDRGGTCDIAAQEQISAATWDQDLGIYGFGIGVKRNRVIVWVENPPPSALAEIAAAVPSPPGLDAVCIDLTITAPPPDGALMVLPDLNDPDPVVECWGAPPMPYSELTDWQPVDEVDHPAVDAFLEELAAVERRGDRWLWAGESSGRRCEPAVVLPEGLGRVEVHLDPDNLPSAEATEITLLVTEQGCANGREMGDALQGPQVVETDDAVVVAFAVVQLAGGANCPGNPRRQ